MSYKMTTLEYIYFFLFYKYIWPVKNIKINASLPLDN